MPLEKRIQFIVGATGTGKSSLALSVVKELNPVIINADSVQFYKSVQIGANKPTHDELAACPHELFSVIKPPDEATASDYIQSVLKCLKKHEKHQEFLLVGGSGFYIQALEKGMFDVAPVSDDVIEKVNRMEKLGGLYKELQKLDPQAAESLHPNDSYRLQRALQIILSEGLTMKEVKARTKSNQVSPIKDYTIQKVGLYLERDELRALIVKRTKKMLKLGLVEEVKALLELYSEDWAPLKSIGYIETVKYLKGQVQHDELEDLIVKNTMGLAKKQQTWFKRDKEILWFHALTELQEARQCLIMNS